MTITEFLLARIAEDEAAALEADGYESRVYWGHAEQARAIRRQSVTHYSRHDPARVLRECEGKRAILERVPHLERLADAEDDCDPAPAGTILTELMNFVLPGLAIAYEDHPDYDPEWRAA